jgi:hypothetical protein
LLQGGVSYRANAVRVSCNGFIEMEITGRKIRTPSRMAVTSHVFNWQYGVQLITDRPVPILS